MLRIQEPVLYPLTLHPNLPATTNDALHQSFQKKKEIRPKPNGPSSLNPAQNNKKNLSTSHFLRQKLPPPSSLLQTTSQVTLNHRQQPTKTKKMQVLFPTQSLSNNNVTKNHDTIFQTSPKGIQKNLGPHAFKNLQKQLLQPQLSPHFARFFCSNPTKKLCWDNLDNPQENFLLKQHLVQQKIEAGLNKRLQTLKLPTLTSPHKNENEFLQHWTTLKSSLPLTKPTTPTETMVSTKILTHWKNLKHKIFSTTQKHFSAQTTKKAKRKKLAATLDKLSQKKEKRKALQPFTLFHEAFDNLSNIPPDEPQATKKQQTNQKKSQPQDIAPEKPWILEDNATFPTRSSSSSPRLAPKEEEEARLARASSPTNQKTMPAEIEKLCRKFPQINASMWEDYHRTYDSQRVFSLESKARSWLLQFQVAPKPIAGYSDCWLRVTGLLLALEHNFSTSHPVQDGSDYYPLNFRKETDISIFDRIRIKPGALLNPPFHNDHIADHLNFLIQSAVQHNTCYFVIVPFVPLAQWFSDLRARQIPGIHLTTPLIFLDKNKQVQGQSPNTICVFLIGAKGPFISTKNSPLGLFYLSEADQHKFKFPLPPLEYTSHQDAIQTQVNNISNKLFHAIKGASSFLEKQKAKHKLACKLDFLLEDTMAENIHDFPHDSPSGLPEWLQHQDKKTFKRKQVNNFQSMRKQFPKKFTLVEPGKDACKTCGQTTHTTKTCWRTPLSWESLNSTDLRDKTILQAIRAFQAKPLVFPQKIDLSWLLMSFWPHVLEQEKRFNSYVDARFNKAHPGLLISDYLQKFHLPFSRTFWGVGTALAIGVHREAAIRMFFGIPRHNAISAPPYEVTQKLSSEDQEKLHAMHLKKVTEGKLVEVPPDFPFAIQPNFLITEKDKDREIVDAFTENILHPPQSLKMVKVEDLLHFPPTAVAMSLDAKSAFDQIKVTPHTARWQGQTSVDKNGKKHYYVALGLPMGVSYCPKRCQGQLKDMIQPLDTLLSTLKVYIDDLLPIIDGQNKSTEELTLIFDSILVLLHKLGIKISEKCFPEITATPTYLGYILNLADNCFYPHHKHLYKVGALIFDALNPNKRTTFRHYLQIKGVLSFALKQKGVQLCHFIDEFIRVQFHAHKRDITEILEMEITPNQYLIDLALQLTTLLGKPENYTFRPTSFHPEAKTKIIVATDASPGKSGGFCLINGSTPDPLKYFPKLEMSESFDQPTDPYHYQRRQDYNWSSTDIERKALHKFLTEYLDPYLCEMQLPSPISLVVLTDSQPLTFQLRQISNKDPLTNKEIKECDQILKKWDSSPQIYWHSRNTRLGRQADARTRDNHLSLPQHILQSIADRWKIPHLYPFLDMYTLKKITPFDNSLKEILHTPPHSTPVIFPHPNTSQAQLKNILEFLSLRQIHGVIVTPGTQVTKNLLPPHLYPTLNLGPFSSLQWDRLPRQLKQKKYPLLAIHL